jgi:hypothetical protein
MFVFKGTTPPTTLNGASIGDQWTDTSVSPCVENKCTSISPMTWVTAEGSGGGGGLSDGDYGDITVSSSGTALTIDNTAVTFAKMQNVSTGVLIGRSTASSGSMEALSVGAGLDLSAGVLSSLIEQYTNDMAEDTIASLIQNGTGITWSYDDIGNTLTPTVSLGSFSTTNLSEGSNLYYTDERVDDRVASLLQNGTGITWTYNDAGGTLTPAVSLGSFSTTNLSEGTNLYFTDERAQDAVGTSLTDSSTIDFTYTDGSNQISAAVIANTSTQKIEVTKNSGAVVGTRKQLNFIEGTNVTLTIADDAGNDQVDITIAASGGGGSGLTQPEVLARLSLRI